MGQLYYYQDITMEELKKLDQDKTIFLMALSPLEAHGPHLPLGTDVIVSEKLLALYDQALEEYYQDYDRVIMPTLALGADALGRVGSINLAARLIEKTLYSFSRSLAEVGFKYLFIADNHGGPRHLMAIEAAARKIYKKFGFYLVNPFVKEFNLMMKADQEFLEGSSLKEGTCGDLYDLHGGTNETSLMLALAPEKVKENYRGIGENKPPAAATIFKVLAGIFKLFGAQELASEVRDLGSIANWSANDSYEAYIGVPKEATNAAGEEMIAKRLELALELFSRALKGEPLALRPPLWSLRILRYLP